MVMNRKPLFLLFVFIVFVILFLAGGYLFIKKGIGISFNKNIGSSIPNILFLTNSVTDFSGKIDKISGNSVWISGKYTITPPPTPPNAPTAIPGQLITVPPLPPSKIITYKVNIAPYTIINKTETPITYLYKKITPTPSPKLTMKDVRVGQIVSVSAASDLRSLKTDEFDAYSLKLSPMINTIIGKIASINTKDSVIILKAVQPVRPGDDQPTPQQPKEIEYAISITEDTEISRMEKAETPKAGTTPKPPQPIKYQITDLKQDIQITVYTDSDVIENQRLKALRIEPPADLLPSPTPSPISVKK